MTLADFASPRILSVRCLSPAGFHDMSYRCWGSSAAKQTVICVHGLTRNNQDFDSLAPALAEAGFFVVCPDVVGRGASDWLGDPGDYGYPQYLADMTTLIAHLGVSKVDWVGTSMGGLIGMMMAAQPKSPIARLVVNDVGPFIPRVALERIAEYLEVDWQFPDLAVAEQHIRKAYAPFGRLSDEAWAKMTRDSLKQGEGGGYRPNYDPAIRRPFVEGTLEDVDLWSVWEAVRSPVLLLRGAESDLLLERTAQEMTRRGPETRLVEIPDCGHAPALIDPRQIEIIREWLVGGYSRANLGVHSVPRT